MSYIDCATPPQRRRRLRLGLLLLQLRFFLSLPSSQEPTKSTKSTESRPFCHACGLCFCSSCRIWSGCVPWTWLALCHSPRLLLPGARTQRSQTSRPSPASLLAPLCPPSSSCALGPARSLQRPLFRKSERLLLPCCLVSFSLTLTLAAV